MDHILAEIFNHPAHTIFIFDVNELTRALVLIYVFWMEKIEKVRHFE